MIDPWDSMIAGDDDEVATEIRADAARYTAALMRNDTDACLAIEGKYGLVGHTPQFVSETLAEMAKPEGELR